MSPTTRFLYYSLAAFLTLMLSVSPANALDFTTPAGVVNCDLAGESLAVKVIYCTKMAVFSNTEQFLAASSDFFLPMTMSVLTFSLVLLGVRIASGERDPQKLVFSYLLKFGFVLFLADNFGASLDGGLTDNVFSIMEQMQASVIPALYGGGFCDITSTPALPVGGGLYINPITYTPWQYIDCVFDYIFGFGRDATIASSIFGFIGSLFFSGTMGVTIFFIGLMSVISLAMFAFRCVYVVLLSYVFVGFIIILVPFFASWLMFKFTEGAFYKMLFEIVSAIFQPFMMIVFLAFALPMLDEFVFNPADEQSLVSTLGKAEDITENYRLESPQCEMKVPSDFSFFDDANLNNIIPDLITPKDSGAMDWCDKMKFSTVDMGERHAEDLWKIGVSLIRILVVTLLIVTIGGIVPSLTARLVGGGFSFAQSTNTMPLQQQIQSGVGQMRNSMSSGALMGGNSGIGSITRAGIPGTR